MMNVTGELLSKAEVDKNNSSLSRHYMCCPINIHTNGKVNDNGEKPIGKKIRRRYEPKQSSAVKKLSGCQIFLGLLILVCQIAPSYYLYSLQHEHLAQEIISHGIARYHDPMLDIALPGVWIGLGLLLTGIVGLVAASKNARCLIVAHLVLNSLILLCALAAAVFAGISFGRIIDCKLRGSSVTISQFPPVSWYYYNSYRYRYYDTTSSATHDTTTTPSPVVVWDQVFTNDKGDKQTFYCTHNAFTVWIVMELMIALGGLVAFGLTIGLIVKNSKALTLCCRRCCTVKEENEGEVDEVSHLSA